MKVIKLFSLGILMFAFVGMGASLQAQCSHAKNASNSNSRSYGMASYGNEDGHGKDIVDLAASQEMLSTLVAAVKAGGLVETLKGHGPFTVFAPTNEAFDALPKGTLTSLLKPENKDQLVKILTYHVVPAELASNDLGDGQKAQTVEGNKVGVTFSETGILVNDARVISADVDASNGVVHVIDRVLLPPSH